MATKVKIFEGIEKRGPNGFTYEELENKINNFIKNRKVKDIVIKAVNTNQKLTLAFSIFYDEEGTEE